MDSKLYINPPLVDRAYHWEGKKQPRTRKELDAFFKSAAIRKVKRDICEMGRRIYARGYTDGNGGKPFGARGRGSCPVLPDPLLQGLHEGGGYLPR